VKAAVTQGQAAEIYFLQYHNAKNNPAKYGDIIIDGVPIEIKTSKKQWTDNSKKAMRNKIKSYNPSKFIMFFYVKGDSYYYQGMEVL